jgi:hypothetical protein
MQMVSSGFARYYSKKQGRPDPTFAAKTVTSLRRHKIGMRMQILTCALIILLGNLVYSGAHDPVLYFASESRG